MRFAVRRRWLFGVAILGLLDSAYLLFAYTAGAPLVCNVAHGCDVVRTSVYASFFGLPTPVYGVIFYSLLAVGALLWAGAERRWLRLPLALLTGSGLVVSGYLTYLEAFVIEAWCLWCVVSAVLSLAAFVIVWTALPGHGIDTQR